MDQRKLLLQMLPGFIPILIFILADEIWGTEIGLIVAILSGIVSLAYYWIKDKKFDKFILFDTLLIIVLGVVSIVLENEVFFKIKPALIGVLMCAVLGISAFTPSNFLMNMSKRYMRGVEIQDYQQKMMKKSMKVMFFLFSGYTLLVFYSVWFMSKEAWAFVSGGLFYVIFGLYFAYEFIKGKVAKKKLSKEELLPLVNSKGEVIGKAPRTVCHSDKKFLHPVVHLHVFNSKKEIFLQKRPDFKTVQPGMWDTAVGGHVDFGETVEQSLVREAFEEISLKEFNPQLVMKYVWNSEVESEYVFCFVTMFNGDISINKKELADGRFWSHEEISENINKGIFTPNFELEYSKISQSLKLK